MGRYHAEMYERLEYMSKDEKEKKMRICISARWRR